jgi:hypothetical protein
MSALVPKSAAGMGSSFQAEALDANASDTAALLPTNNQERFEPQEILLLREFFLLLDEWDRQRNL